MRIMGFDQSIRQTGFAVYDGGDERRIVCGSFTSRDETPHLMASLFARHVRRLIAEYKPVDYIIYEAYRANIMAYEKKPKRDLVARRHDEPVSVTVNPSQLLLPMLVGIIVGLGVAYSIPTEGVGAQTWRAGIFGVGGGKLARAEAKAKAKQHCRWLGINAANEDECEAALIALWGHSHSQLARRLAS